MTLKVEMFQKISDQVKIYVGKPKVTKPLSFRYMSVSKPGEPSVGCLQAVAAPPSRLLGLCAPPPPPPTLNHGD